MILFDCEYSLQSFPTMSLFYTSPSSSYRNLLLQDLQKKAEIQREYRFPSPILKQECI